MAEFQGTVHRTAQEAVFAIGRETGVLLPGATAFGTVPALTLAGYYDVPGVDINENAAVIPSAGTYRGVGITKGRREVSFRNNIRLGNIEFLKYAVRNSGYGSSGGHVKCLPLFCVAAGNIGECVTSEDYGWLGRYCFVRDVSIQFQDQSSQPLQASVEIWPLGLQTDAAALAAVRTVGGTGSIARESLITDPTTGGGDFLMWHHTSWYVTQGGTTLDYRNLIQSISIQISNNIERVGYRKEDLTLGDASDLSRIPTIMVPMEETVTVSLSLHDKLPAVLWNAAKDSNRWGMIEVVASNGVKTLRIQIDESRLQRLSQGQTGPNQMIRFSANTASRAVRVITEYAT